jgi:Leucine Rich Repeat (LRR) protein
LTEGQHFRKATLVFLGSILGTMVVSVVACLVIAATLAWLMRNWSPATWLLVAIGLGMIGMMVAVVWRWWRLSVERRFRFSLRGMLVGIAVFALWLGVIGVDLLRWGRQVTAVVQLYGQGVVLPSATLMSPFNDMTDVDVLADSGVSALCDHAGSFADLQWAEFRGGGVTDAGLERAAELGRFPKLRSVAFTNCNITDAGLERLAEWKALEVVAVHGCGKITDVGLQYLVDLPNLQRVELDGTNVTEQGINALCEALPDCLVIWDEVFCPAISQVRRIEIWSKGAPSRQVAVITEVERIGSIKKWIDQATLFPDGWQRASDDGLPGNSLSGRFVGRRRRLCEIGLGNGMFLSIWRRYRTLAVAEDEEIRVLLGVDAGDWDTGKVD